MTIGKSLCKAGIIAFLICLPATFLIAQEESPANFKHSVYIGGGFGMPRGDMRQFMASSGLVRFGYGYRVGRYFQVDLSWDVVWRAAGIGITQQSLVGEIRITDSEHFVPFGGRVILPLAKNRLEFFAGGGGAYLRYEEDADIPGAHVYGNSYVDYDCPSCTSRDGWGYYGNAGANIALDRRQRVWVGVEVRYVRGRTSGVLLSPDAPYATSDRWINSAVNLSYRF